MHSIFPFRGNVKVKLEIKMQTGVDTSKFARKVDLASLKSEIDKLDLDNFKTSPVYLSKLNDSVKTEVVKKTVYDELVKKVNAIQTSDARNVVKKANYNTKIAEIEKKILDPDRSKFITIQEFIKLTAGNFTARLE